MADRRPLVTTGGATREQSDSDVLVGNIAENDVPRKARAQAYEALWDRAVAATLAGSSVGTEISSTAIGSAVVKTGAQMLTAARITNADVRTGAVYDGVVSYWRDTAIRSGNVTSQYGEQKSYDVSFDYTGSVFEVGLVGQEQGLTGFEVWSDGVRVGAYAGNAGALDGRLYYVPVTLPSDGKRRTIRMHKAGGWLNVMNFQPTALLALPSNDARGPHTIIAGDSFTEGTGASTSRGFVDLLLRITGWANIENSGSGGTGYVAANPSGWTRPALGGRLTNDVINRAPDLCIVAMGYNDVGGTDATTVSAAQSAWTSILGAGIGLVVIGPWDSNGDAGQTAASKALDAKLKAAARAMRVPYLSPETEGWMNHESGLLSGDAVHPNDAGHKRLAGWIGGHLAAMQIEVNSDSVAMATKTYTDWKADSKVTDSITDAVTTIAPSQNAVYDALALKAPSVLTGYTSGSGTVAASDTVLQAIQKLNGNDGLKAPLASPTFTGTVTMPAGTFPAPLSIVAFGKGTTRAAGTGDNPFGHKHQFATTYTSITFRGATADASGNGVYKVQKNGVDVSGMTATVAAANQVAGGTATGSWAFAVGDILTLVCVSNGTTPGLGLMADLKGTV